MAFKTTKKAETEAVEMPVEITAEEPETKAEAEKITYKVEVTSAVVVSEKRAIFNATVNGVKIDGFALCEYTNQQKQTGHLVQYPSRKGSDGKYYHSVWFPISKEVRESIVNQVLSLLG